VIVSVDKAMSCG